MLKENIEMLEESSKKQIAEDEQLIRWLFKELQSNRIENKEIARKRERFEERTQNFTDRQSQIFQSINHSFLDELKNLNDIEKLGDELDQKMALYGGKEDDS